MSAQIQHRHGARPRVVVPGRDAAMGDIPAVGQHNAAILAELGLAL
jgi:hypothetical protein